MNDLPFGLTDALHINEPFPWRGIALAILVLWLLYRFVRSLRRERSDEKPPPARVTLPRGQFAQDVKRLRERYLATEDFRAGCHELAGLLRRHFGAKRGLPFPVLTVQEIEERLGDTALARLFGLLETLQFSRTPPDKSDFEGACALAIDVSVSSRR